MNTIKWNNQEIKLNRLNVICGENLRDNYNFFDYICSKFFDSYYLAYGLEKNFEILSKESENTDYKNLFIEYPETLLHPKQQTQFSRLLARKLNSNKDVSIFVLTHSDYIIKEFNNLIILNYELTVKETECCDLTRDQIMEKYGYSKADCLSKNDVCAFHVTGKNVYPEKISDLGFSIKSIDDEINRMNRMWDDLTDSMECAYE